MIPNQTITDYPVFGDSATKVKPDDPKYSSGFIPGDLLPAEWHNWLLYRGSKSQEEIKNGLLSAEAEINTVLTSEGITPDQSQTDQLLKAIRRLRPLTLTSTPGSPLVPGGEMNVCIASNYVCLTLGNGPYAGYRLPVLVTSSYGFVKFNSSCVCLSKSSAVFIWNGTSWQVESGATFVMDNTVYPYIPTGTKPSDWKEYIGTGTYHYTYAFDTNSSYDLPDSNCSITVIWRYSGVASAFAEGAYIAPGQADLPTWTWSRRYYNSWSTTWAAFDVLKPAIGVPTPWMGPKPDWAIDFGNGAADKYAWANYPNLNNATFKGLLDRLVAYGHMSNYDTTGFYVPDLRGLTPMGYGTNAIRTGETTYGGDYPGHYLGSQNKSHSHLWGFDVNDGYWQMRNYASAAATGMIKKADPQFTAGDIEVISTGSSSWYNYWFELGKYTTAEGGAIAKPPTVAIMWILRFV